MKIFRANALQVNFASFHLTYLLEDLQEQFSLYATIGFDNFHQFESCDQIQKSLKVFESSN